MSKLSIVIPVYNTYKYIDKCLKSIMNQNIDYEIILVDDGSTDESGKLCDNYQNENIKVIHINNLGVSNARNVGILNSSGKYITFIDSDDYIDNCYKELIDIMDKGYDLVTFGISIDNEEKKLEERSIISTSSTLDLNRHDTIKNIIDIANFNCVIWNKIYRLDIIKENNIFFDKNIYVAEDSLFAVEYALKVNKSYHVNKPYYHYIIHSNSALRVKNINFIKRVETSITAYQKIEELLNFDDELKNLCLVQEAHARLGLSEHYYNFKYENYKELIKNNKKWIKENKKLIYSYASKKEKLRIKLFLFSIKLDCFIVNYRNKHRSN